MVIVEKIAKSIYRNNEDKDISYHVYYYGIQLILSTIINLCAITFIAIVFGCFTESLCYILTFASLRVFAGGYHAENHFKCVLYYIVTFFLVYCLIVCIIISRYYTLYIALSCAISIIIVFTYSPKTSENKPLSTEQKNKHKKISRYLVVIYTITLAIASILCSEQLYIITYFSSGLVVESLTLVPQKK